MQPFVHIGARFHLEPAQCIQHRVWNLRRRRIVEVVKPRVGEPGKLALELEGIECVLRYAHLLLKMPWRCRARSDRRANSGRRENLLAGVPSCKVLNPTIDPEESYDPQSGTSAGTGMCH